jgi:hypothetical protein
MIAQGNKPVLSVSGETLDRRRGELLRSIKNEYLKGAMSSIVKKRSQLCF